MSDESKWKCPSCGQGVGFVFCNCDGDTERSHGLTSADPCQDAFCECGWKGTLPLNAKLVDEYIADLKRRAAAWKALAKRYRDVLLHDTGELAFQRRYREALDADYQTDRIARSRVRDDKDPTP